MSNFVCPFCWKESKDSAALFVCKQPIAPTNDPIPCESFVHPGPERIEVASAFYKKNWGVDLNPLLTLGGRWHGVEANSLPGLPFVFPKKKGTNYFGTGAVTCPRCRSEEAALHRACPHCLENFPVTVFGEQVGVRKSVALIGFAGSGKTCWLASLIGPNRAEVDRILVDPALLKKASVLAFRRTLPHPRALFERTPDLPFPFVVKVNCGSQGRGLALFRDVPGEKFADVLAVHQQGAAQNAAANRVQMLALRAQRMVLMINGMSFDEEVASLAPLVAHLAAARSKDPVERVAICVGALDTHSDLAGEAAEQWHRRAFEHLSSTGLLEAAINLCGEKARVRVFGLSALGQSPVPVAAGDDVFDLDTNRKTQARAPGLAIAAAMDPVAVLEPLQWLIRTTAPNADPQLGIAIS